MLVRWTPKGIADFEALSDYLDSNHPQYAQHTLRRLYDAIIGLTPTSGGPGRKASREWILSGLPYIIVFRPAAKSIDVVKIHHGAEDWK